jgi:hypothetical protein
MHTPLFVLTLITLIFPLQNSYASLAETVNADNDYYRYAHSARKIKVVTAAAGDAMRALLPPSTGHRGVVHIDVTHCQSENDLVGSVCCLCFYSCCGFVARWPSAMYTIFVHPQTQNSHA